MNEKIEVHLACGTDVEVRYHGPDGIAYCPVCDRVCEGDTHVIEEITNEDYVAYFATYDRSTIGHWHWIYHHDFGGRDAPRKFFLRLYNWWTNEGADTTSKV